MFRAARQGEAGLTIGFDFRIDEAGAGKCLLTTETRIYAVGTHMRRGLAAYWRMIYPGSALIRREWLKAIRLRAEAEPGVVARF